MSSLFRFAQSAIHQAGAQGGYAHPASPYIAAPTANGPDLDAFADLDDASDSDNDNDSDSDRIARHNGQRAGDESGDATASTSSTARASPQSGPPASSIAPSGRVPGAYDFEPQNEPSRVGGALSGARAGQAGAVGISPFGTGAQSAAGAGSAAASPLGALAHSRRASMSSQRFRDEISGRREQEQEQQVPALAVWRGLVSRFRGVSGNTEAGQGHGEEGHGLLFSQDDSEEPSDTDGFFRRGNRYPPARDPHLPLPPRPSQFAPPIESATGEEEGTSDSAATAGTASIPLLQQPARGPLVGRGQGHDGVFANLAAKPDNPNGLDIVGEGPDKEEVLPPYEAAQHDPSPAYWETTVFAPSGPLGPDDILVDGMPVGNVFSFAWNLLVSMSFQFVGFLLTFILHTTHAAKNGSRAGLGITLIQLGFYLKQRTDGMAAAPGDETGLNGGPGPSPNEQRWTWWDHADQPTSTLSEAASATATLGAGVFGSLPTQVHGALSGVLAASEAQGQNGAMASGMPTLQGDGAALEEVQRMSESANEWMAFLLVTVGSFLLIGSCLAYWRAVRWARAIRAGQGPSNDAESTVAI